MPEDILSKSRPIVDASTPGPWEADGATIRSVSTDNVVAKATRWNLGEHDAAFIAHAREALPIALGRLESFRLVLLSEIQRTADAASAAFSDDDEAEEDSYLIQCLALIEFGKKVDIELPSTPLENVRRRARGV